MCFLFGLLLFLFGLYDHNVIVLVIGIFWILGSFE